MVNMIELRDIFRDRLSFFLSQVDPLFASEPIGSVQKLDELENNLIQFDRNPAFNEEFKFTREEMV
jgi:hypothetical protein